MDTAPLDGKLQSLHLRATQTLQLIGLVEANRVLFDTTHPHYSTKKVKIAAWRQITAAVLGTKLEEVSRYQSLQIQHKWKSLRTAYVRQKRKNNPAIPYRYADLMSFLDPYLRRDEAASGALHRSSRLSAPFELEFDEEVGKDITSAAMQDACIDLFDPIEEDLTCDAGMMVQKTIAAPISTLSAVGSSITESNSTSSSSSATVHIRPDQIDELDGFFMQIARTVRKFSPRKIIELKMQIFNLVSQSELDELDALNKY